MRRSQPQILIGLLLIVGGLLFLFQSLGILPTGSALFWALAFATGGGIFLYVFAASRENWWASIPSAALFGIASAIALDAFLQRSADPWAGAVFMGVLSLGFWGVWLANRQAWWAIIPAGAVLSVSGMILVGGLVPAELAPLSVLFLGMGLTFGLLLLVPTAEGRMRWPAVPALVLLLLGGFSTLLFSPSLQFLGPGLLILGGLLLIVRVFRK
ncbi:MAG: hypothetical protein MUO23_00255 [Anaerolineales bacterium]|nr:hypothetical protein [Anaerolineales bacterium]